MANRLGIENLTLMGMPPIAYVELAAELGCVGVSLGLMSMPFERFGFKDVNLYPTWSLVDDLPLRRDFKAALASTGVAITLGEGFRADPALDVSEKAEWLDILAELGGQRINAVSIESDRARTIDQLGKLADMTIERGMQFTIEFAPPNAINSLSDAISVVEAMFDAVALAGAPEDVADPGLRDPLIAIDELDTIVGQDGVDLVGNGSDQNLEEGGGSQLGGLAVDAGKDQL